MRRRQFIGWVGAGAAISATAWKGLRPAAASPPPLAPRVDLVIYDERYPDAERFADQWKKSGARSLATAGEIVSLWREQVADSDVRRIVGLTLHSDFEIVRSLASAHRLRVLHRELRAARTRTGTLTYWMLG